VRGGASAHEVRRISKRLRRARQRQRQMMQVALYARLDFARFHLVHSPLLPREMTEQQNARASAAQVCCLPCIVLCVNAGAVPFDCVRAGAHPKVLGCGRLPGPPPAAPGRSSVLWSCVRVQLALAGDAYLGAVRHAVTAQKRTAYVPCARVR
jgi:hypothetical protein